MSTVKVKIDITEELIKCEIEGSGKDLLNQLTHLFVHDKQALQLFDMAIKMAKTHNLIELFEQEEKTEKTENEVKTEKTKE
ncbi:hypothetical protein ACSV4D_09315 [Flavobacterium sp. ARAG 55.4]|uniref:hypothetical protein n=1 Tax=Flavobacterium sp. ARAG 55.4 TaxID=3451357 RepID=UPI003F46FF18